MSPPDPGVEGDGARQQLAIDHLAMVTGDTAATVDFYTRVMGWPVVGAQRGNRADGRTYLITAFRGDRWLLEFEEIAGRPAPPPQVPGYPHLGLDVGTPDAYEAWTSHLRRCGVQFLEVRQNDCFLVDPNGLSFQHFERVELPALRQHRALAP
jgi:catechol 2,3-dioxygenase-like lactoylglutathione lyase family enzyme